VNDLRAGDPVRVAGYRLLGRLGEGGMGQVYLGASPGGRKVAVKLIRPEYADDPDFRLRFSREVAAARKVGGFHTAMVIDADPDADPPWMVTTYIPGPSLAAIVTEYGPLDADVIRGLGAALSEGLIAIHACGLVHRDLKPANIILAVDGPRIIDFGIARSSTATTITATGVHVGTYPFMSPEHLGVGPISPASDVFSLGAVLVFAANGQGPFDATDEAAIVGRILFQEPDLGALGGSIGGIIRACLAKDPGARPGLDELLRHFTAPRPGAGAALAARPEQDRSPRPDGGELAGERPAPAHTAQAHIAQAHTAPARTATLHRAAARALAGPDLDGYIDLVRFSADGRFLVTATGSLTLRVWDTATWRPVSAPLVLRLPRAEYRRAFRQVLFTPDGDTLVATVATEPEVWQWDVASGQLLGDAPLTPGRIGRNPPKLSPDGGHCLTAGPGLLLWDIAARRCDVLSPDDSRFQVSDDPGDAAAFSPDSRIAAVPDIYGSIHLWDTRTRASAGLLRAPLRPGQAQRHSVRQVAVSGGRRLAAARIEAVSYPAVRRMRGVYLWDIARDGTAGEPKEPKEPKEHRLVRDAGSNLAFSPDGSRLATMHDRELPGLGSVHLWDTAARAAVALPGSPGRPAKLAFSPDGSVLAAAGRAELLIWDTATRQILDIGRGQARDTVISDAAFSPDGQLVVTAEGGTAFLRQVPGR
jgi:WD40 repeat protein